MQFQEKLKALITLLEQWLQEPNDYVQLEHWHLSAQTIAWGFEFSEQEEHYVNIIIDMYYKLAQKTINARGVNNLHSVAINSIMC